MTDEDIINGFKYCVSHIGMCTDECIYGKMYSGGCKSKLDRDILDLINRQNAEIDGLIAGQESLTNYINLLIENKGE